MLPESIVLDEDLRREGLAFFGFACNTACNFAPTWLATCKTLS